MQATRSIHSDHFCQHVTNKHMTHHCITQLITVLLCSWNIWITAIADRNFFARAKPDGPSTCHLGTPALGKRRVTESNGDQISGSTCRPADAGQYRRPNRTRDNGKRRRVESRMHLPQLLEEQAVSGHCVVDARSCERCAVGRAENRDENNKCRPSRG